MAKLLQLRCFSGQFILPLVVWLLGLAFFFGLFFFHSLAISAETATDNPNIHIRTLAASCAACHGSNGNSAGITPSLAGLDAQYFAAQMLAFKQGTRNSTVMRQHAAGLTDVEIEQLAHYFALQKKVKPLAPPAQSFDAAHE